MPITRYRTLFMNDLEPSKRAARLLKARGIRFSQAPVGADSTEFPEEKLPTLITDQGEWRGLEAIQRYVRNALAWGEI